MQRKKVDVDVIKDVLLATREAFPNSVFIKSLLTQYEERGGLSKKQLQGLHAKAINVKSISDSKLATLEAVIQKKPTRYKSALPEHKPLYTKDESVAKLISSILEKFPQHKRVLFLEAKYNSNDTLSPSEKDELEKFVKLLKI